MGWGSLVANNSMGVSVFDLFGGVLKTPDMRSFLTRENVKADDYVTGQSLAIRCFLLLIDMQSRYKPTNKKSAEIRVEKLTDEPDIKTEEVQVIKTEVMEDDETPLDAIVSRENTLIENPISPVKELDEPSSSGQEIVPVESDFFVTRQTSEAESKQGTKNRVYKKRTYKHYCNGDGCFCGKEFETRDAKEAHYIEKGCYKCEECGKGTVCEHFFYIKLNP